MTENEHCQKRGGAAPWFYMYVLGTYTWIYFLVRESMKGKNNEHYLYILCK